MSDRDHSSAIAFLDKRRRERITVGNSDQTIQIPENPELRAAIADAIEKLNPVPGADTAFAVRYVMLTIYLCSGNTSPQRAAPLSQIQKQLLGFANALIAAGTAAANLSGAAIEALNAEKSARGLSWCSPREYFALGGDEFGDFVDWGFPELIEVAKAAAHAIKKEAGAPRVEHNNLLFFAGELAAIYKLMTGKPAPVTASESRFVQFVERVLAAAPTLAHRESAPALARAGARAHRDN